MTRYIDANVLLEQISKKKCEVGKTRYIDGFNDGLMRVRSMISTAPTADVVPKSEVAKEFTCFVGDPHNVEHCPYLDEIENAKAEVAREIIGEIKSFLDKHTFWVKPKLSIDTLHIDKVKEYHLSAYEINKFLYELVKKYTEAKND